MGLFGNIRQAMQMRNDAKRLQDKIASVEETYTNGGVSVRVRGDMSVISIAIAPAVYDELKTGKTSRFETMLLNTVNGAINRAKKTTQNMMSSMMMSGEIPLG